MAATARLAYRWAVICQRTCVATGFRALHVSRPCRIMRRLKAPRSAAGMNPFSSCSTLTGPSGRRQQGSVSCNRSLTAGHGVDWETRSPKATLRTTLAVFRPPGISPVLRGPSAPHRHSGPPPRWPSDQASGLGRKKPVDRTTPRRVRIGRGERGRVGICSEERRRHHVHPHVSALAERMVAASSWNGSLKASAQSSAAVPG